MTDDDFLEDDSDEVAATALPTVAMLIVNDEPGMHDVTRIALRDFVFQGHRLEMVSAYSSADARRILAEREDIAVILLDVVMETESAGLDLVQTIRRELGNADVRIILRTGQPGQAPEENVIVDYDINDYKAKAELTRSHLLTSVVSALRSWRDIQDLHRYRRLAFAQAGRQAALTAMVLDLVEAPAAVLDADGLVSAANAAFAARAGCAAELIAGSDLADLGLGGIAERIRNPDLDPSGAAGDSQLFPVRTEEGETDAWLLRLSAS